MKKRVAVILLTLVVLLVLGVCLLPLPTRIHQTMNGAKVSPSGQVLEEFTFTLSGWKYDYLFQRDQLTLEVEIPNKYTDLRYMEVGKNIWHELGLPYLLTDYMAYDSTAGHYIGGYFGLTEDAGSCFFGVGGEEYYIGSTDADADFPELLEYYEAVAAMYD